MNTKLKGLLTSGLSLVLITSLVACGGTATQSPSPSASQGTDVMDEVKAFRVGTYDPQVALDTHKYTYSMIMKVTDNVVDSLVTGKDGGAVEPELLTQLPDVSEDMLTYSFELLSDVKFHNGEILTASDVKYSLERLVRMKTMGSLMQHVAGYQDLVDETATELTGIAVQDDTHFTITLDSVYTPFLSVLSTPYCAIYPAKACEEAGDDWGKTVLIGTGPFKFVSYQTGVGTELVAFDDYRDGRPEIDTVSYKYIDDANTQMLEFKKGNVDYVDVEPSIYPVYEADADLKNCMGSFQPIGGYYLAMNVETIPDANVRKAISMSIDRNAICESIFHNTVVPASGYIPAGIIGHDDDLDPVGYDPEGAKALLAEAGFADGLDLRVTTNTKYPTSVSIATAIQAQAKAAGINVTVEPVDSAAWTDMKANGGVDCAISNWYVDYNDPDSMLYPASDGRTDQISCFWHNEEFKSLMEQGVQISDAAERQAIYERADYILSYEESAFIPIYNETKFYLLNPSVTNFEIDSANRFFLKDADITG